MADQRLSSERTAFAAGWNARETGSGHRADGLESCFGMFERGFNFGDSDNAMKYIWRADEKASAIEDLEKAAWYVRREIERRNAMRP